MTSLLHAGFEL